MPGFTGRLAKRGGSNIQKTRRKIVKPFARIDEFPDGPGVYVITGALGDFMGAPNYIGLTKSSVKRRLGEHRRTGSDAHPLIAEFGRVEFYPTAMTAQAVALERELIQEKKPLFNKQHNHDELDF